MQAYDDALRYILETGGRRKNRTGIDTISTFSVRSEYRIDTHFPLATKRKLYPKAVFAELLWMLSGSTSNDDLVKLGANFWTPWADQDHPDNKKFYEQTGFPAGYLGPVYGWQMRHFGATYRDWLSIKDQGWTTKQINDRLDGVDQISWLVNEIKNNPTSRRLLVSLWNPRDMPLMRLPPCHYCFHVDIDDEGRMSLLLNQRSCDFPVGVPANIQFYSALCYMLAQQTGYKPYRFIHHAEDAHIYVNQIEQVEEYLSREQIESPTLELKPADDMFSYTMDHFVINNYHPHPAIKVPVAV
jgi:thymidylate synthase